MSTTTATPNEKLVPQKTHYTSRPVAIPDSFLQTPPSPAITARRVRFADSAVPEYAGCLAVVLDDVLSAAECRELVRLAEASAEDGSSSSSSPWRPALVNVGGGFEVAVADYRNSDRIIWDSREVADRLWRRCLLARGEDGSVAEMVSRTPGARGGGGGGGRWVLERLNERMRFLKYTKGQFFKPHCDGKYGFVEDGVEFETHYTLHLYLNDSVAEEEEGEEGGDGCVGGATSFLSGDLTRKLDVEPKAGSVLIFQHERLLHQGAEVLGGTKYTMRTDILYRWVPE